MEFEGLLFDLDGTLIETQLANFKSYNYALSKHRVQFNFEEFTKTKGIDSQCFLANTFPNLSPQEIEDVRRVKASCYKNFFTDTYVNKVLLNFTRNLTRIKRIGLVTTGKKQNVDEILDFHNLKEVFHVIVTGDDVSDQKPSPEPYLKATDLMKLSSNKILVFEDSDSGCESAIAAGLSVVRIEEWHRSD